MLASFNRNEFEIYSLNTGDKFLGFRFIVPHKNIEKIEVLGISDDQKLTAFVINTFHDFKYNLYVFNNQTQEYIVVLEDFQIKISNLDLLTNFKFLKFSPDKSLLIIVCNGLLIYNLSTNQMFSTKTLQISKLKFGKKERVFYIVIEGTINKYSYEGNWLSDGKNNYDVKSYLLSEVEDFQVLNKKILLIVSLYKGKIIVSQTDKDFSSLKILYEFPRKTINKVYFSANGAELIMAESFTLFTIYNLQTWQVTTYDLTNYSDHELYNENRILDKLLAVTRDYLIYRREKLLFYSRHYNQIKEMNIPETNRLVFSENTTKEILANNALKQLAVIFVLQTLQRNKPISLAKDIVTHIITEIIRPEHIMVSQLELEKVAKFLNDYTHRDSDSNFTDNKTLYARILEIT